MSAQSSTIVQRGWNYGNPYENVLAASMARGGRLRQPVLKAMFEGRLVHG